MAVKTMVDKAITIAIAEEIVDVVLDEALQLVLLSREKNKPPPDTIVGDTPLQNPPLQGEIKKMIHDISTQTAIVGQGDMETIEKAKPEPQEELENIIIMLKESVDDSKPCLNLLHQSPNMQDYREDLEVEVQVIEPDYDSSEDGSVEFQSPPEQLVYSNSAGLIISREIIDEIVYRAEQQMFSQNQEEPQDWVMVQDGGKGDEIEEDLTEDTSAPAPIITTEENSKNCHLSLITLQSSKRKKWKLGVRMRKFFTAALGRHSKSDRSTVLEK